MSLKLPELDDRNFGSLLTDVFEVLPRTNPEWTSRNPSDPGIMVLEVFAYLIEMDIFQLNQVSLASYVKFLNLLGIEVTQAGTHLTAQDIKNGIIKALKKLDYKRAISEDDIKSIVDDSLSAIGITSRVYCLPNLDFSRFEYDRVRAMEEKDGHLVVLIAADNLPVSQDGTANCYNNTMSDYSDARYTLSEENLEAVKMVLFRRRILTTRIHVRQPELQKVKFSITLISQKGADLSAVKDRVIENIYKYFCPIWGGENQTGYKPGQMLKISEVIEIIEDADGVEFTTKFESRYEVDIPPAETQWALIQNSFTPKIYEIIRVDQIELEVIPPSEE